MYVCILKCKLENNSKMGGKKRVRIVLIRLNTETSGKVLCTVKVKSKAIPVTGRGGL
jgi:hypothetical protein